ncbi:MAG: 3-oxoacyl-[acyl-carrier-protein] reductase [Phycisphaeraceae bacterium]
MTDAIEQRLAIVTGASRGIGAAIAQALALQGRHVVLMSRSADKLNEVAKTISDAGGKATVCACDVADHKALADAIERIADDHKRLDILVNNAGVTRDQLLLRMSDEDFDAVINTNLKSVFVSCRAALRPMMRGKWGRIINIGSVSGLVGNPGQANYAAAKAGLSGLTKSIAKEMAAKNITANVIAPGFIDTDMTEGLPQQVKDFAIAATPLKRFGKAAEIAAAVAFLASEEAGFVTGQTLAVDGGMTMC